ncbi:LuxR family transcriptional regulator [Nocardioides sp. GY 10127]|uniref:helix-turn-helix transcriptional regulator n=1 Tax=Nocardioides sp. GY 10127 TaxID=2569762 RepID=UPI0010A82649|nr:LuxR family transcriptional regulator [Nocardioides sp. GY 10127]TIC82851.1 hypothetical protein E8D37_09295 [Nocardioides sp. GY 10127]
MPPSTTASTPTSPVTTCTGAPRSLEVARACAQLRAGKVSLTLASLAAVNTSPLSGLDRAHLLHAEVDARLARGDLHGARDAAARLVSLGAGPGGSAPGEDAVRAVVAHGSGLLALALGDSESAADELGRVGELLPDADPVLLPWRTGLALALVPLGRQPEAVALATEHLRLARLSGSAHAEGLALRTLANVTSGGDRSDLLREARRVLGESGSSGRLLAQVDTDLGGLLLLAGGRDEAVGLLRSAETYAGRQGLAPLLARAQKLLVLVGETAGSIPPDALSDLTVAERRVAALATQGLTNRQVAEELHVTVKAIEWHLSRVYRKLAIGSRRELAAALGV